ncbi:MAG: DMT family transporter [Negativicutes bacterium]|nr:DMT family transporter [Negativicutes bacterium]
MPSNPYLLSALTMLFWSGVYVTGKVVGPQIPPFTLTCIRFCIATPLIFWALWLGREDFSLPHKSEWPVLAVLSLLGTLGFNVFLYSAVRYTSAINTSLINAMGPIITVVLGLLFFKEKLQANKLLGIGVSLIGVFMVVTNADWEVIETLQLNPGDGLMGIAVLSFSSYVVLSRVVMKNYRLSPLKVTAYTFLLCTLFSFPGAIYEGMVGYLPRITILQWVFIMYMAVFGSVLAYLFQLTAVQKIGAANFVIFNNLIPVFTIILSILFLGEKFDVVKFISTLFIIAGVYVTVRQHGSPALIREE